jgi:hypothetical protein
MIFWYDYQLIVWSIASIHSLMLLFAQHKLKEICRLHKYWQNLRSHHYCIMNHFPVRLHYFSVQDSLKHYSWYFDSINWTSLNFDFLIHLNYLITPCFLALSLLWINGQIWILSKQCSSSVQPCRPIHQSYPHFGDIWL